MSFNDETETHYNTTYITTFTVTPQSQKYPNPLPTARSNLVQHCECHKGEYFSTDVRHEQLARLRFFFLCSGQCYLTASHITLFPLLYGKVVIPWGCRSSPLWMPVRSPAHSQAIRCRVPAATRHWGLADVRGGRRSWSRRARSSSAVRRDGSLQS